MIYKLDMELAERILSIETGKVAKQADGAVVVRYGDTMVLVTAVAAKEPAEVRDFLPLTVEYREKAYAAGKIPGGFFKREGRPSEKEITSARLVDRPIRPLFPKGFRNEVQIVVMVLSYDQENDPDVLGLIGASVALSISGIPFLGPIGAVRVGKVYGDLVINPTSSQLDESDMDIVVATTSDSTLMLEGKAREVSEDELLEAIRFGHEAAKGIIDLQKELVQLCGKPRWEVSPEEKDGRLVELVRGLCLNRIRLANTIAGKEERQAAIDEAVEEVVERLSMEYPDREETIASIVKEIEREEVRRMILEEKRRIDGRGLTEVRPITCEVGVLPRTHGSGLFSRGQTQSLAVTTLGTKMDEQRIDDLEGESWKSYMLHYNFPPFSVGEVRPIRGPGRREIGHGALAERAIEPMIPSDEVFPYTIRIVSDILESNGSSSMATICAGSLSLMDAGVPVKNGVAGIAVGLVRKDDRAEILTDILGLEDRFGDMDFKVAGSEHGITAIQVDIKTPGISYDIIKEALERAREGRLYVLDMMERTISKPKAEISVYAPRIISFKVDLNKIGDIIGPGGRTIRAITEQTGATIDIGDDGTVTIASADQAAGKRALELVKGIVEEPEVGRIYSGTVKRVANFGAIVEIMPGKDGLVHISDLDFRRIDRVEDVVNVGDEILVKVIGINPQGKIKLSRKAVLKGDDRSLSRQRRRGYSYESGF